MAPSGVIRIKCAELFVVASEAWRISMRSGRTDIDGTSGSVLIGCSLAPLWHSHQPGPGHQFQSPARVTGRSRPNERRINQYRGLQGEAKHLGSPGRFRVKPANTTIMIAAALVIKFPLFLPEPP